MKKMIEITTEEYILLDAAKRMRGAYKADNVTRKVRENAINKTFWDCMKTLDAAEGRS